MLHDVFGTSTEKGLIHASNKQFDEKLKVLKKRWDTLEKEYRTNPVVFRWFTLHIAPIIRENVRVELLQDLEIDGEKYTQNNSESLNALLKRYVNFQKQDILQFVNDLEECVQEQQNEISKAVLGLGRWTLSPSYSHVKQNAAEWFGSMSQVDKKNALLSLDATTSMHAATVPCSLSEERRSDSDDIVCALSVPHTSLTEILSDAHVKAMWKKATKLLNENKVIKAPDSNPKTRWIASDTTMSPHVVTTSKSNPKRYVCDKECVGWKAHNICAHCIACARRQQ